MIIPPTIDALRHRTRADRRAFTLLEVLLSAAIGVLLMAALYVAMNVQLEHAQAGRDAVEQSLLVRALLRRMSNDIAPGVGPELPASNTVPAAGGGGGGAAAGGTTTSSTPIFSLQGDSDRLILWVSRISSDLSPLLANQAVTSDLHRVTYWMASTGGLARQEVKLATSDDALVTVPPNIPGEANLVIAEEVQSVTFRYFDGTMWQDSWDGTQSNASQSNASQSNTTQPNANQPNSSSGSPTGPPQAVEITLVVATPSSQSETGDTSNLKTYRHVVAIPTANGASPTQ